MLWAYVSGMPGCSPLQKTRSGLSVKVLLVPIRRVTTVLLQERIEDEQPTHVSAALLLSSTPRSSSKVVNQSGSISGTEDNSRSVYA